MKKFTVFVLLCAFTLGACSAIPALNTPAPSVDSAGTVNAMVQTSSAQTQAAQPTPTLVVPDTPTLVVAEASPTLPPVTDTAVPDLSLANLTTTPATATGGPTLPAPAFTATLAGNLTLTASPTLGIRTYGTLPPQNQPYTGITITNRSKAEAYISLQIVTDQGYTIIEYPVKKVVKISIPTGDYTYVVWVGGRKFVGYFHASQSTESIITIFKDKIVVKQGSYPNP